MEIKLMFKREKHYLLHVVGWTDCAVGWIIVFRYSKVPQTKHQPKTNVLNLIGKNSVIGWRKAWVDWMHYSGI